MSSKKHVVFIVPDGVGIKNYLYSDVLKHVGEFAKITIWSPLPESAFAEVEALHPIELHYKALKLHSESILTRLFRESASYARLCYNAKTTQNDTILLNWRRPKGNFKLGLLYRVSETIGRWAKLKYSRILNLENRSKKHWSSSIIASYKTDLKDLEVDSIFITHQRVPGLMPICIAAKQLNIKTTTAIFSWDNLPKARLCVSTDVYILWSEWMKNDMDLFYPEIDNTQLKTVGTPQFEFYKQDNRITDRASFAKNHGLNPELKWVCFSGDDEYTSPYDPTYLNDVAEAISTLEEPVQLIFRRCPVDFTSRYDSVLEKYKDIIVSIDPIWYTASKAWVGYFSKLEDVDLQVNLAKHCEGVINLGSTMALDFATFNKPCLYLNYDTIKDENWSTNFIYKFHHFKSMKGLDAVGWLNSKSEIKDSIKAVLDKNVTVGSDRELWLEKLVCCPLEDSSKELANTLH
ncbi:hypothetical protein [Winogradskyella sp. UBA3174]|uniref:hypothetical protein n=1 Tax=Winogradskyella sp. UBA3174 TaxID=1947785 RepID=UPI0025D4EE0A|nr:hypothetical protein [Winogradskyella sp. UBA3174]|tara:strand:+ start:73685 stop:75070 length:1386 start_codon:yes stop_codon:yes gene_type:complete